MRERIKDLGRLQHILNAINVLLANKGKYDFEQVKDDPIIFFGFVKHVEIIGEAVYMLTKVFNFRKLKVSIDAGGITAM